MSWMGKFNTASHKANRVSYASRKQGSTPVTSPIQKQSPREKKPKIYHLTMSTTPYVPRLSQEPFLKHIRPSCRYYGGIDFLTLRPSKDTAAIHPLLHRSKPWQITIILRIPIRNERSPFCRFRNLKSPPSLLCSHVDNQPHTLP